MSDPWYWNDGNSLYGPMEPEQVVSYVKAGQLLPTHRIRVGADGNWTSAADLVEAVENGHRIETTDAAADSINRLRHARVRVASGDAISDSLWSRTKNFIVGLAARLIHAISNCIGFVLEILWTKAGKVALSAVLLTIAALVILPMTHWAEPPLDKVALELQIAMMEIDDLRSNSANDEEWDQAEMRILAELAPLTEEVENYHKGKPTNVGRLSQAARARSVIRRHVISAGKYCVPHILAEIRNENDPSVDQFRHDLAVIQNHITGVEVVPLTLADAQKQKKEALKRHRTWESRKRWVANLDPATSAIVVVDVALVVGGLGYFFSRRRRKVRGGGSKFMRPFICTCLFFMLILNGEQLSFAQQPHKETTTPKKNKKKGNWRFKKLQVIQPMLADEGRDVDKKRWNQLAKFDELFSEVWQQQIDKNPAPQELAARRELLHNETAGVLMISLPLECIQLNSVPGDTSQKKLLNALASADLSDTQRLAAVLLGRRRQRVSSFAKKQPVQASAILRLLTTDTEKDSHGEVASGRLAEIYSRSVEEQISRLLSAEQRKVVFGEAESPSDPGRVLAMKLQPESDYASLSTGQKFALTDIAKWYVPFVAEMSRQRTAIARTKTSGSEGSNSTLRTQTQKTQTQLRRQKKQSRELNRGCLLSVEDLKVLNRK